jgi:endoglucanase
MLGAAGQSYIVGFGKNPPRNPHHRNSALNAVFGGRKLLQFPAAEEGWTVFRSRSVNANTITGGLVGGPGAGATAQGPGDVFVDKRLNDEKRGKDAYKFAHERNEVALDYNAALLLALIQTCR